MKEDDPNETSELYFWFRLKWPACMFRIIFI